MWLLLMTETTVAFFAPEVLKIGFNADFVIRIKADQ